MIGDGAQQPVQPLARSFPAAPVVLAAGLFLALLTILATSQAYTEMVYLLIGTFAVAGLVLPTRWGIAVLFAFVGIAGILKDVAAYSPLAHLGNDIVLGSLLAGHVARAAVRARPFVRGMPFKLPILLLLGAAFALTFAPITSIIQALGGWKAYVLPALIVPVAAFSLRERDSLRPILAAVALVGIANAVAALVEQSIGPQTIGTWGPGFIHTVGGNTIATDGLGHAVWRPFGLTQDAGSAAVVEAIGAIVLLHHAFGRRSVVGLAAVLASMICVAAVVQSSVRSALVMLAVGGVALVVLTRAGNPRKAFTRLAVLALLGAFAYIVIGEADTMVRARVSGLLNPTAYAESRGALLPEIGSVLTTLPLGIGMGKVVPAADVLQNLAGAPTDAAYASENMLLAMLLELGWLGGVFFLTVWFEFGRGLRRAAQRGLDDDTATSAVIILMLFVVGMAGAIFVAQPANLLFWVFATVVVMRGVTPTNPPSDELPALE